MLLPPHVPAGLWGHNTEKRQPREVEHAPQILQNWKEKSEILSKGMATVPFFSSVPEQAQPEPAVHVAAHGAVTPESRGTAGSAQSQHWDDTRPLCDTEQRPRNLLKGWTNVPGLTQSLERITHPEE